MAEDPPMKLCPKCETCKETTEFDIRTNLTSKGIQIPVVQRVHPALPQRVSQDEKKETERGRGYRQGATDRHDTGRHNQTYSMSCAIP